MIPNFIGGELVEPLSNGMLDNVEPATGKVYSRIADSDERDVERAVAAAETAFPAWSSLPDAARSRLLLAIAARIEADLESFARAESVDTGKPLTLAREVDIPIHYTGFPIDNVFVVGYGLDLDDHFRNLPYIGVYEGEHE